MEVDDIMEVDDSLSGLQREDTYTSQSLCAHSQLPMCSQRIWPITQFCTATQDG